MGKRGAQPGGATKAATAAKKAKAVPAAPKAQGTTRTKRTPTRLLARTRTSRRRSRVVAGRLSKGVTQYQVKWVGWSTKDNTWEPIEHLAGKY